MTQRPGDDLADRRLRTELAVLVLSHGLERVVETLAQVAAWQAQHLHARHQGGQADRWCRASTALTWCGRLHCRGLSRGH
jgi:hypothetical protein